MLWASASEREQITQYQQQIKVVAPPKQKLPQVDLAITNRDYAKFLPSISTFYQTFVSKQRCEEFVDQKRIPKLFENGIEGLNFLNKEQGYFYYPWALYSAGHAQLDVERSKVSESMIQGRDRTKTLMLGDSGGYQVGTGVIKFDWQHFYEQEGDATYIGKADKTRLAIINWLEATTDYSMVLDIPSRAAVSPYKERSGMNNFSDTLKATLFNNDFFVKHRQGKTKFLNVLQGQNEHDSDTWYSAVKHYPFEGWAMGGLNTRGARLILKRLIELRDDKLLDSGRDIMHFLGIGTFEHAVLYTALQREIQRTINDKFIVTFDCSSPFLSVSKGQIYSQNIHTHRDFLCSMTPAPDNRDLVNSDLPFPWTNAIGQRLTMGDICRLGYGVPNKTGKVGKTSWDSFSYALLMAHNVYQHVEGVQRANALADIACTSIKPTLGHWNNKQRALDPFVPNEVIGIVELVKQVFSSQTPMTLIDNNSQLLHAFDGRTNKLSTAGSFNELFN